MAGRNMSRRGGLVYSTEQGSRCPKCGWPKSNCACHKAGTGSRSAPPGDGIVRVWRQVKGRKGKGVTVVKGLLMTAEEMASLGATLKKLCGSGGTVKDGAVEIQGDHRDKVLEFLHKKGIRAKKAGG